MQKLLLVFLAFKQPLLHVEVSVYSVLPLGVYVYSQPMQPKSICLEQSVPP
jgi:hypothetical protein